MFRGRIREIESDELAGAAVYNPMARALRFIRSQSPAIALAIGATGGLQIDLDTGALMAEMDSGLPFACRIEGDKLLVREGSVWLCDRRLDAKEAKIELVGPLAVWVSFDRQGADIKTGQSFPFALDVSGGRCNHPLARVVESAQDKKVLELEKRHEGDVAVFTMPHIFMPGYGEGTLARITRSGQERWVETAECEEDEL